MLHGPAPPLLALLAQVCFEPSGGASQHDCGGAGGKPGVAVLPYGAAPASEASL